MFRVFILQFKSWPLLLFIGSVVAGCGSRDLGPKEMLERGKYLSDTQRSAEAISLFDRLAEVTPDDPEVFYMRGLCYERTGNVSKAIDDYTTAIGKNARYAQAYNNRAVLLAQNGDAENAIEDFSNVLRNAPEFALGFKNRGLAYHDMGAYEKAAKDFDRAIKLEPNAQSYFLRGNLRLELKNYHQAVADYDKSLELDRSNSRAWLNRSMALARTGDINAARDSLKTASEMDSDLLSTEIMFAFRSLFASVSIGNSIELDAVKQVVEPKGWNVSRNQDEYFPFTIEREGIERKLFVAQRDVDNSSITISADVKPLIFDGSTEKSLLVILDSPTNTDDWEFIEHWNPSEDQVLVSEFRLTLDSTAIDSAPKPSG